MTAYDASDFLRTLNIGVGDFDLAVTENILDQAVGLLNINGASLSQMSGDSESKIGNYGLEEWTAITQVAKLIYDDFVEDAGGNMSIQGVARTARSLLIKPDVLNLIQLLAAGCRMKSDDPVDDIRLI